MKKHVILRKLFFSTLYLSAFTAIDHKQVVANVEHLSARIVPQRGQCRTAPQNIDFKLSHNVRFGLRCNGSRSKDKDSLFLPGNNSKGI